MIHVPVVLIIGSIEQRNTSHYWYPKAPPPTPKRIQASLLLEGLLGSDLGRVATLPLSAVGGTGRETGVALSADLLLTVVLRSKGLERGLDDTTSETEDKMEGGLLLDVVVRKGPAVLELLSGEDQSLLVRGNTLLVLDLGLDIVDGVGGLNLEGDGLSGKTANNPSEQILQ